MSAKPKDTQPVDRFLKTQIMRDPRFLNDQYALDVVLLDGKRYTLEEAQKALDNFMKRKVN